MTTIGTIEPIVSLNASIGSQHDRAMRARELAAMGVVSKGPAQFSVQAIAERPPYCPTPLLAGSGPGAPVLPPELKPFFFQLMLCIVYLTPPAEMLGLDVVMKGDDYEKFFHQLALSYRQRIYVQMMMLDPDAVNSELADDNARRPRQRRRWRAACADNVGVCQYGHHPLLALCAGLCH